MNIDALLKPPEPDGFPVGMICKVVAHSVFSEYIGDLVQVKERAETPEKLTIKPAIDEEGVSFGPVADIKPFYGQEVAWCDGSGHAFLAISWLRPATPEEIAEAGLELS